MCTIVTNSLSGVTRTTYWGSYAKHDGDGNDNVTKQTVLMIKTMHVHVRYNS